MLDNKGKIGELTFFTGIIVFFSQNFVFSTPS